MDGWTEKDEQEYQERFEARPTMAKLQQEKPDMTAEDYQEYKRASKAWFASLTPMQRLRHNAARSVMIE